MILEAIEVRKIVKQVQNKGSRTRDKEGVVRLAERGRGMGGGVPVARLAVK
jgi:hypothetical protein